MLLSRVVSFAISCAAFSGVVLAKPTVLERRADLSAVQEVMANLNSSASTILPQIQDLATNSQSAVNASVPLVNQLTADLNNATAALQTLNAGSSSSSLRKRQDATLQGIAQTTADLVMSMTTTLNNLVQTIPSSDRSGLSDSVVDLYSSTNGLLTQADTVAPGLSDLLGGLLGGLLSPLLSLLSGLGGLADLLTLVLSLLSLLGL